MRINLASVYVDDQEKALRFYTDVLGFAAKEDFPVGPVADGGGPRRCRRAAAAARARRPPGGGAVHGGADARRDRVHLFAVDDVAAEYERLRGLGVRFTQPPTDSGPPTPATTAVLEDTCGNLIGIACAK